MRIIKNKLIAGMALCAGIFSCTNESNIVTLNVEQELLEPGYSISTRVDGTTGEPEHGDAYTIISYLKGYSGSSYADKYRISNSSYMIQYGYYAYDANGDYGLPGALIPVEVSTSSPYKTSTFNTSTQKFDRDQTKAQRLVGIPVSGTNTTNQGYYRTAIIYPAIPVRISSEHGYMAVFNRTDNIYASHPDDKNGDGVQDDPFEIEVRENGDVFDASGVIMYPVKAAIKVYLYSHYYENDDPVTYPTKTTINFSVEEINLVNAGSNGWFNSRTGVVYPNYNYDSKNTYSMDVGATINSNAESLSSNTHTSNETIPSSYTGIDAEAQHETDEIRVFPTDYRGSEGGGNDYIMPMTLSLKLKDSNGLYNNADIPIAIEIERNKIYTFYVNVKSKQIGITYSRSDWTRPNGEYAEIGSNVQPYATINIDWPNGGWTGINGGSSDIGD